MIDAASRVGATVRSLSRWRSGFAAALLLVLAGCGQSGPLVLPGELDVNIPAGQGADDDQGENEDDDEQ